MNLKDLDPKALAAQFDEQGRDAVRYFEQRIREQVERATHEVQELAKIGVDPSWLKLVDSGAYVFFASVARSSTLIFGEQALHLNDGIRNTELGRIGTEKIYEHGAKVVLLVIPNAPSK